MIGIFAALSVLISTSVGSFVSSFQPQQEQTQLRQEVKVTLKLVQVYVTDKKGNPVLDLNKGDFILFDEGDKKTITEFERHILSLLPKEKEAQTEIIETPAQPARELIPRKFFLLFDFAFNNAIGIEKARRSALHFIDTQLQPRDEVGVLSYSAIKSLTLHELLTTDHQKVREAVSKIGFEKTAGRVEELEGEYWRLMKGGENPKDASKSGYVFDPGGEQKGELAVLQIRREETKLQAYNFARKMTDLAKALRYVPGHKAIVFFSSGVPYSLLTGIRPPQYNPAKFDSFEQSQLFLVYEDMLKELSASNCAVYALDTQELRSSLDSDIQARGTLSLQKMTSATGGKYFGNINSYEKHLEKIQDLTGCYYVLGYYVDDNWDGAYHKIKVEVTRPGLNVHAQKGYFNAKPFSEYDDLERMLHLVDLALSEEPLFQTPVRFPLEVVPCASGSKGNLCLQAQVPLADIQDVLKGKSEFVVVIFDDKENIAALKRNERLGAAIEGKPFSFGASFNLPPGACKCRLVIRNLETGRAAVASATAVIPGQ